MPRAVDGLDLESLRLLVDVGELGSLGRAARAAGIAQPSASRRVALLERRLGIALLERGPRGSTLTDAGTLVAGWAGTVLDAAGALLRDVAALRADRRASLHVAASLTIAEYLVPRWLAELRAAAGSAPAVRPGVQVGLRVANSARVGELVVAGEADLGFVEGPDIADGLASRTVAGDRLAVVVAPGHRWVRRRAPLPPAELAGTPIVVRERGSGTRDTLDRALAAGGLRPAEVYLELGSTAAVKGAVAAGAAPAVLSAFAVAADLAAGSLVEVPVAGLDLRRALRAVWPRGRPLLGPAADLLRIAARKDG